VTHKYFDTYILMNMFDDHNFNSNDVDKFCSQETNLYSRRHINHLLSIYYNTYIAIFALSLVGGQRKYYVDREHGHTVFRSIQLLIYKVICLHLCYY
jgi:hypothetical protein